MSTCVSDESTAFDIAVRLLHDERSIHIREVERIDTLLRLVEGKAPSSLRDKPSLRSQVRAILQNSSQDWSAQEVLAALSGPLTGTNPERAVRSALRSMQEEGDAVRTTRGRYRAVKPHEREATVM
jgi:hypothetical protein